MPLISYFSLTPGSSSVSFLFLSTVVIPFFSVLGFLTVAFIPYTMYFSPNLVLISWFLSPGSSPLTFFLSLGYSLVPLPSPCSFLLVFSPLTWSISHGFPSLVLISWFPSPGSSPGSTLVLISWFPCLGSYLLPFSNSSWFLFPSLVLFSWFPSLGSYLLPFLSASGFYPIPWFSSPGFSFSHCVLIKVPPFLFPGSTCTKFYSFLQFLFRILVT